MFTTVQIYEMMEARRAELGLSQAEVGRRAFNRSDGSVIQNLKRGSSPSLENLQAICEALGLEVYVGEKRENAPIAQISLDGTDYASIPFHEASLSAGNGAENGGANIVDYLAFRRDWLRRIGVSPTTACLARVSGDSMTPTLRSGDMVLIDMASIEPKLRKGSGRKPPIFAFVEGGEARIKRIERPDQNALLILSDNAEHLPELRTGPEIERLQTSIIGKVVWSGHTIYE